jgi:large subunit ribosomal protein L44
LQFRIRLASGGTVAAESNEAYLEDIEKWKAMDPRTGEKRIGKNFSYTMELGSLAARLGTTIDRLPSLKIALTHRSALPPFKSEETSPYHNSRLSVLGVTTLIQYLHHYMYKTYPNLEGYMLWDVVNYLTHWQMLESAGQAMGYTDLIVTKHLVDTQMNGKVFAAILGAVYIDEGMERMEQLINQFVLVKFADTDMRDLIKIEHPKFMLRAILRAKNKPPPTSRLLRETGRHSHFPTYVVGIYSGTEFLGEGAGTSLKRAENEAAMGILKEHFMTELKASPLPTDYKNYKSENKSGFKLEKDN